MLHRARPLATLALFCCDFGTANLAATWPIRTGTRSSLLHPGAVSTFCAQRLQSRHLCSGARSTARPPALPRILDPDRPPQPRPSPHTGAGVSLTHRDASVAVTDTITRSGHARSYVPRSHVCAAGSAPTSRRQDAMLLRWRQRQQRRWRQRRQRRDLCGRAAAAGCGCGCLQLGLRRGS